MYFVRIPLKTSPHIVNGNALTIEWNDVLPAEQASYVLGNPPFVGAKFMDDAQREDAQRVFSDIKSGGLLDFVAAWYVKAASYMTAPQPPSAPSPRLWGEGRVRGDFQRRDPALEEKLKTYARELRVSATDAEQRIWYLLRNRNFFDFKFRRQHPVAGYILDFYCADAGLAIELDGGQHSEQIAYDAQRDAVLQQHGIHTLRFWNNDVLNNTEGVLMEIANALPLTPTLSPQAGRGSAGETLSPKVGRGQGEGRRVKAAFVSTNSITQGEQAGVLWGWLLAHGIRIQFAHRTFQWSNEARGMAAVHCVIIGFGAFDTEKKIIYEYEDIRGGHYLFTPEEKAEFLSHEHKAAKWFRRWIGADEFINNYERWCLWLGDCPPDELRRMPEVMKRVEAVREVRLASKSAPTQKLAATPTRFHVENIPDVPYLLIPRHSSETRYYLPMGFIDPASLSGDANLIIGEATLFHFGILSSAMHNAWMRYTCGRIKSDYRYSAGIVYNNYPWPDEPTDKQRAAVEAAAQAVLDSRAQFPQSSLADLYDPLTMPPALVKAHQTLDRAVDACYRKAAFTSDAQRVEFLFERYQQLTSLLPTEITGKTEKRKRRLFKGK